MRTILRRLIWAALVSLATIAAWAPWAPPEAVLWPRWTAHDPASAAIIDHAAWDRFLSRYVTAGEDGVNRLPYAAVTPADRAALDAYIGRLAATPIDRYRRAEQFAFWINLYNALTVRLIVERYPVKNILRLNISPGWLSIGPWGKKLVRIAGEAVSLNDIEHRILRPIWRDPRIHYAINCASIGCPNLGATAYTGDNVDRLLTSAAREYINNRRGAQAEDGELFVSSIYNWYRGDFGGTVGSVIAHLRKFAAPELLAKLKTMTDIAGYQYDWTLNDASR